MSVTPYAPCGWDPIPVSGGLCCPDTSDPTLAAQANQIAASVIWHLTGMMFGCCSLTVRPCKAKTCDPITLSQLIYWDSRAYLQFGSPTMGVLSFFPTLIGGQVFNIACGCPDSARCGCDAECEVRLPGPICSISNVTIDGIVIDPSMYTVYDGDKLVFLHALVGASNYAAEIIDENQIGTLQAENVDNIDSPQTFQPDLITEAKFASICPPRQDYNLALGNPGTWSVTYSVGTPVPIELNLAAGIYANEVAKALVGDKSCGLPGNVQQVARQGVSVLFRDPLTLADAGLTGIVLVDQIIRAVNPSRLTQAPRVWFPGKLNRTRRESP